MGFKAKRELKWVIGKERKRHKSRHRPRRKKKRRRTESKLNYIRRIVY